ncbi:hypothetical protein [Thermomonospora cellulosilytica]|uniref:Uncharacterized protein n=1 Tax=Thermomonospora cellulosilytica TaxID=1411118 RepID=A0A7W3MXD7_9ACTN|nr:hypothetical protein [Thermomonospora cellulosilytica]MBA9003657.1 hypothetical protein [Thermomonospora cellulosilytica]
MAWPWQAGERITAGRLNSLSISAMKSSPQTVNNSTNLVNDTQLFLPGLLPSAWYRIDAMIRYSTPDNADFRMGWTVPAGAIFDWSPRAFGSAVTTTTGDIHSPSLAATDVAVIGGAGGGIVVCRPVGIIFTGVGGTLQFRWAQGTAQLADTIMRISSSIVATKIG